MHGLPLVFALIFTQNYYRTVFSNKQWGFKDKKNNVTSLLLIFNRY